MIDLHGEGGRRWSDGLPERLAWIEARWAVTLGAPYPRLSYNWVAPGTMATGEPIVVKLGMPSPELQSEIEALRRFDGRGAARLLGGDADRGVLLLEALAAERSLADLDEDEACRQAARTMKRLWREVEEGCPLPTAARWLRGFSRLRRAFADGTGPFPRGLVERAEARASELAADSQPSRLLHGDLHHGNVLAARRSPWLAIDPKGIVGDPAMEPHAFLHNELLGKGDPRALLRRRVALFAEELAFDEERIRSWAFSMMVLSAWWTWEDHGRMDFDALQIAEWLMEGRGC